MRRIGKAKLASVFEKISEAGANGAVFISMEPVPDPNIEYITGFFGMNYGAMILRENRVALFVPEMDYDRALKEASADDIIKIEKDGLHASLLAESRKMDKAGINKSLFPLSSIEKMKLRPSKVVDIGKAMAMERMIKEPGEIEMIRESAGICNRCLKSVRDLLASNGKENEVAAEIERLMKKYGADKNAFETIVSTGPKSAIVHPYPSAAREKISRGVGIVDFGAVRGGYCSDVTTSFVSSSADRKLEKISETVVKVWEEVKKNLRPGVPVKELCAIYENALKGRGYQVKHSLGHGIGLTVHEFPSISDSEINLLPGMVFTIEPGVYVEDIGGCRIENMVLLKRKGFELLTKSSLIKT